MHKEGALFPLATARHKYEIDMCTGSLPQKILLFSLPLMATGMLQLLFNAADIIVVGRYVGSHALAAVGSNGSIINLIVNLFMGISIGGSAVIAQHYGAAQYEDVSEATHTCMLVGLISGFFVMVVGVVCTPAILRLMDTPTMFSHWLSCICASTFWGCQAVCCITLVRRYCAAWAIPADP